jgi:hypothetical protein
MLRLTGGACPGAGVEGGTSVTFVNCNSGLCYAFVSFLTEFPAIYCKSCDSKDFIFKFR